MMYAINFFSAALQLVVIFQMCSILNKGKNINVISQMAIVLAYSGISLLIFEFISKGLLVTFISVVLMFCCSYAYKMGLFKRIFSVLSVSLLLSLLEIVFGVVVSNILKISVEESLQNEEIYFLGTLIPKLIVFIIIGIVKPFIKDKNEDVNKKVMIPFLISIFVSFYVIIILSENVYKSTNTRLKIMVLIAIILLICASVSILYILEFILKQEKQSRERNEILKQIDFEKKYYKTLADKQVQSAKEIHDLKNKLFAIQEQLLNNFDEGIKQINNICSVVSAPYEMKFFGLVAVDALLYSKFEEMETKNIVCNKNINIAKTIEINELDLCVVLGNMLNNSIEACEKVGEQNIKEVFIQINQKDSYLNILIKNTCAIDNVELSKKSTTKTNKFMHGFGLENIREIVSNYCGVLETSVENNIFVASVIMKENNEQMVILDNN